MADEPKVMSQEEFLGRRGLASSISGWGIDKMKLPHGETQRQRSRRLRECEQKISEYHDKRNKAIREYNELVEQGKIRKPTTIEATLLKAQGHPDLPSVQAARRMCYKRGIDWRTGKKLEEGVS